MMLTVLPTEAAKTQAPKQFVPAVSADTITCENNESMIQLLEVQIIFQRSDIEPLLERRSKKDLKEEENALLLQSEIELLRTNARLSVRKFFSYYCDHPEKLPEPEETVDIGDMT
jgi:hypothetical protein